MRTNDLATYGFLIFAVVLTLVAIFRPQWLLP